MKTVVVISEAEGMVVRGIMKKLNESQTEKIRSVYVDWETPKRELERYEADIYIISIDGISELNNTPRLPRQCLMCR